MKHVVFATFALVALMTLVSCQGSNLPATQSQTASTKRYQLKGKVVSVDKLGNMVNIDAQAIPGFMDAMMMPYQVKPASELDQLSPGDEITGELVVQGDKSWLENIAIKNHAPPGQQSK